ncbi:MAG: DUF4160 domain-containing protein [Terriglobales bacterium]
MGKVEAFALAGIEVWFNSNDHIPPHFHAKRPGEWEIRVFFLECTAGNLAFQIKWGKKKGPLSGERAAMLAAVLKHRAALLKEWEQKVCTSK